MKQSINRLLYAITNNPMHLLKNGLDLQPTKIDKIIKSNTLVKINNTRNRQKIPTHMRNAVWIESDKCCHYCKIKLTKKSKTIDHVIPFTDCKKHEKSNMVIACQSCNGLKADINPETNPIGYDFFLFLVNNSEPKKRVKKYKRSYATNIIKAWEKELKDNDIDQIEFLMKTKDLLSGIVYRKPIRLNEDTKDLITSISFDNNLLRLKDITLIHNNTI